MNFEEDDLSEVDDLYYDAMEYVNGGGREGAKEAERLLLRALKLDPHRPQTYVGLICVYGALKNKKKFAESAEKAYEETVKKFPTWPKQMEWGWMENREYLRAIQYKAELFQESGEKGKAIELYELLLCLNPNDNQGVRYVLAGVYAGISGQEVNEMFDEGNAKQNWSKLENLVKNQNAKHKFWKQPKY